jgi:uncharacterized protein YjiS (DUF1127 family)
METPMTYVNVAHADRPVIARRWAPGFALPAFLPTTWMRRVEERRVLKELLRRPDRILADVGADRAELEREASKPFWKA